MLFSKQSLVLESESHFRNFFELAREWLQQ